MVVCLLRFGCSLIHSMSRASVAVFGGRVLVSVAMVLMPRHRTGASLREKDAALLRQAEQITRLQAENERLSHAVARVYSVQELSGDEARELLRPRGQIRMLGASAMVVGRFDANGIPHTSLWNVSP